MQFLHPCEMDQKSPLSALLKAFFAFVFAFGLALSPPASAHAASGLHDGIAANAYSENLPSLPPMAAQTDCGKAMGKANAETNAAPCCTGIFLAIMTSDANPAPQSAVSRASFTGRPAPLVAARDSGLLRPPKRLT